MFIRAPVFAPSLHHGMLTLCLALLFSGALPAQEPPGQAEPSEPAAPQALTETETDRLDGLREVMPKQRDKITDLEKRLSVAEGPLMEILNVRLDNAWLGLLEASVQYASEAASLRDQGFDISTYESSVKTTLESVYDIAEAAIDRISSSVDMPGEDLPPTEQAIAWARIFEALDRLNKVHNIFSDSVEVARSFGLDVSRSEAVITENTSDRAINTSVFLELTLRDINALRAAQAVAPEDATIKSALAEAQRRLKSAADAGFEFCPLFRLECAQRLVGTGPGGFSLPPGAANHYCCVHLSVVCGCQRSAENSGTGVLAGGRCRVCQRGFGHLAPAGTDRP